MEDPPRGAPRAELGWGTGESLDGTGDKGDKGTREEEEQ